MYIHLNICERDIVKDSWFKLKKKKQTNSILTNNFYQYLNLHTELICSSIVTVLHAVACSFLTVLCQRWESCQQWALFHMNGMIYHELKIYTTTNILLLIYATTQHKSVQHAPLAMKSNSLASQVASIQQKSLSYKTTTLPMNYESMFVYSFTRRTMDRLSYL